MIDKDYLKFSSYWKVISDKTGYDFSGYSTESLNIRLEKFISSESIGSPEELKDKLYSDKIIQEKILGRILINYTEMFRDPGFFLSIRRCVIPYLATHQSINIWHAGCSSGEEVYSLAIILDELGLLNRCNIYATDINELNLRNASSGIYPLQRMQESASRYFSAGGINNLSKYYTAYYDHVIFRGRLKDRIKFIPHNLVSDAAPNMFHLILCRNVFIYFNQQMQKIVLKVLSNCLYDNGYLGIGIQEQYVDFANERLEVVDRHNKIYRKTL